MGAIERCKRIAQVMRERAQGGNNDCNGSGPHTPGEVRVMPYGGGGNDILCRACWQRALAYRRDRNRELGDFAQFKLPAWETAKVYQAD